MFTLMSKGGGGIKLFKKRAVAAIVKEYTKLDDMNVLVPENPDVITP